MENFADQCLDMAESILSQNLEAIEANGRFNLFLTKLLAVVNQGTLPLQSENILERPINPLGDYNLHDLGTRTITAQAFAEDYQGSGLAYA